MNILDVRPSAGPPVGRGVVLEAPEPAAAADRVGVPAFRQHHLAADLLRQDVSGHLVDFQPEEVDCNAFLRNITLILENTSCCPRLLLLYYFSAGEIARN